MGYLPYQLLLMVVYPIVDVSLSPYITGYNDMVVFNDPSSFPLFFVLPFTRRHVEGDVARPTQRSQGH